MPPNTAIVTHNLWFADEKAPKDWLLIRRVGITQWVNFGIEQLVKAIASVSSGQFGNQTVWLPCLFTFSVRCFGCSFAKKRAFSSSACAIRLVGVTSVAFLEQSLLGVYLAFTWPSLLFITLRLQFLPQNLHTEVLRFLRLISSLLLISNLHNNLDPSYWISYTPFLDYFCSSALGYCREKANC